MIVELRVPGVLRGLIRISKWDLGVSWAFFSVSWVYCVSWVVCCNHDITAKGGLCGVLD